MDEFLLAYDHVLSRWPVPVEVMDIESRYGTTRVNACGPTDGPPVVLLPGAGATSTVWFANVAALSRRHRVYAIDPIGQPGRSVVGAVPIRRVDDLLASLEAVLDGLGLTDVDLVGHSYGAMVAVEWETGGIGVDAAWLDLLARGAAEYPSSKTVVPRRPKTSAMTSLAGVTAIFAADSKVHNSSRVADRMANTLPNFRTVTIPDCAHHSMPTYPSDEINGAMLAALG